MANVNFSLARIFKRPIKPDGEFDEKVPVLFRSLARLIYMDNKKTVQEAVTALQEYQDNGTPVFETMEEYNKALEEGKVSATQLCVVKEDTPITST